MKKNIFVIIVLAVSILALPMSAGFAKQPEPYTATLFGTYFAYYSEDEIVREFPAGESVNFIGKYKQVAHAFSGDIEGSGWYEGNWVIKNIDTPEATYHLVGIYTIKNAEVSGIGTGDLIIKMNFINLEIIQGTGDLKGIKGSGMLMPLDYIHGFYYLDIQINQ